MGMGVIEPWHLVIILVIALVIFGPGKLGDVGGALGRGIREFKSSMNDEELVGKDKPEEKENKSESSSSTAKSSSANSTAANSPAANAPTANSSTAKKEVSEKTS